MFASRGNGTLGAVSINGASTAEFSAGLNGKPALKRAREVAEAAAKTSAHDQVSARHKLAGELVQNGVLGIIVAIVGIFVYLWFNYEHQ